MSSHKNMAKSKMIVFIAAIRKRHKVQLGRVISSVSNNLFNQLYYFLSKLKKIKKGNW